MISFKTPNLFLALAKSSKAPFVRDDIKLLNSQEWAVIEKEVRSENGRRANQGAVSSVANQMELETGEMPTLKKAASKLGSRANQGTVLSVANQMKGKTGVMLTLKAAASELGSRCNEGAVLSVANQMKEKTGVMPTLKAAAYEMSSRGGKASLGKPKGGSTECYITEEVNPNNMARLPEKEARFANTKTKAAAQLVHEGAVPSISTCSNRYMKLWIKQANDNDFKTTFIQGKKEAKGRLWKLTIVVEEPEGIAAVDDDMFKEMSAECRKADAQKKSLDRTLE